MSSSLTNVSSSGGANADVAVRLKTQVAGLESQCTDLSQQLKKAEEAQAEAQLEVARLQESLRQAARQVEREMARADAAEELQDRVVTKVKAKGNAADKLVHAKGGKRPSLASQLRVYQKHEPTTLTADHMRLLRHSTPLFSFLGTEQLEVVMSACSVIEVPRGEAIIKQGDFGDAFYVVVSGRIDITIVDTKDWKSTPPSFASARITASM